MAEPYLNPDSNHFDPTSDEALERALEKVRAEARARVRQRKKAAAEAAARDHTAPPDGRRDPSQYIERQPYDRRKRTRATSPDRRETPPALAASRTAEPKAERKRERKPSRSADRKSVDRRAAEFSGQIGVRPALLFGLVLAVICAVGMLSIRAIHSATPPIEGFASKTAEESAAESASVTDDPLDSFNRPVTAALMRTQGWVLPRDVQTIDPALARARRAEFPDLASEIALVPALEMDIDTTQDLNLLASASEGEEPDLPLAPPPPPPPPPQFSSLDPFAPPPGAGVSHNSRFKTGPRLALPPMRPFGPAATASAEPETADPLAGMIAEQDGGQSLNGPIAAVQPAEPRPTAPSMIEQINQSRQPPQSPPPPEQTAVRQPQKPVVVSKPPATLAQLQEASCSRLGFFARIGCKDDIREEYCANRWNRHPDCARLTTVNNF